MMRSSTAARLRGSCSSRVLAALVVVAAAARPQPVRAVFDRARRGRRFLVRAMFFLAAIARAFPRCLAISAVA